LPRAAVRRFLGGIGGSGAFVGAALGGFGAFIGAAALSSGRAIAASERSSLECWASRAWAMLWVARSVAS